MRQIYCTTFETPLGIMTGCVVDEGLCLLEFGSEAELKTELNRLKTELKQEIVYTENALLDTLKVQLAEYFSGNRKIFDIPLFFGGTDFQKRVWHKLLEIPYGKTRTYKEQAISTGNLESIRAVASTNGKNKIAILVPCHRVIGSDGSLTGYAGGLWRKRFLLELESGNTVMKLFS